VIAEIGINHDGDLEKARRLILSAHESGCHGIKFQYRNLLNAYASDANEIGDEIILAEIKRAYLNAGEILTLRDYAHTLGLLAGISFFTTEDLRDFTNLNNSFDFFKIPSAELLNHELIIKLLETGKQVYISVGMHAEKDIEIIFESIQGFANWIPMHCVSNYPLADHNIRLGYITYLGEKWGRPTGYSSHDSNWENVILALGLGATVIERHITEDINSDGLDHSSSSTHEEFIRICEYVKNFEVLTEGNAPRIANQGELLNKQNLGRSFYANDNLNAGSIFQKKDFSYRSPQTGLNYSEASIFEGREITEFLSAGAVLTAESFATSPLLVSAQAIINARELNVSLPVRLSDYQDIRSKIPVGSYEFHLSYKEANSGLESFGVNPEDRFSVHLPDYINPTTLIDPFSSILEVRNESKLCISRVVAFAQKLSIETDSPVPIVASLSGLGHSREMFYPKARELFDEFTSESAPLTLQWLPPFAWYFGGSVKLDVMNNLEDINYINELKLPVTMDTSHLLLGQSVFNFNPRELITEIRKNIIHWHISDASGADAEGLQIGEGGPENEKIIGEVLTYRGLKVVEVWQGHFSNYLGFKKAVNKINSMKVNESL
jgi:N-acetylneuraminate synthase